jgi:hypothetical protein
MVSLDSSKKKKVSLFVWSEFVEISRLDINFTAITVMPAKRTCEAATVFCEVHLAFFLQYSGDCD